MMRDAGEQGDRVRRRRRIILFVGLWLGMFAWANIPPYRGNVLDQKASFFVWHWHLYSVAGHGICDVRYFDMNQGGAPIERWTLLGHARPGLMPDRLARTNKQDLFREYEGVCRALRKQGDREPDVQVSARCAEQTKWKQVEIRARNVCPLVQKVRDHRRRQASQRRKAAGTKP